jgi:HD-GYP domain-containing protein (c-di-GMP phosphodiesterase class II)/GAF domain-containing protein
VALGVCSITTVKDNYDEMSELFKKLSGVRDLKKILETTVKEIADTFNADVCQIMLSNPLDGNVTSICEYKQPGELDDFTNIPAFSMPLTLHGRTLGSLSLNRHVPINQRENNIIRVILGELNDIIRHAQINDVVQRDTFRDTFLVEIANVMAYSLGIGDALFMVVNILGKVLHASRCLFICTDDTQAGWKCFEFWQQDKVQSCQDYRWPTTDSPVIAQTLLSAVPLAFYEGQQNSYVSPVQEELQFIGVKSLLGIRLRSSEGTHGCVILQQCDYRRAWTRNEIDMVQNVADKVADALYKLPAEKRAREPIMQLHQRIVAPTAPADGGDAFSKIENVRRALKGALGQQAIPSARKGGPAPAPAPAKPAAAPTPAPAQTVQPAAQAPGMQAPPQGAPGQVLPQGAPGQAPVQAPGQFAPPGMGAPGLPAAASGPGAALARAADPFADLDFGDISDIPGEPVGPAVPAVDPNKTWDKMAPVSPPDSLLNTGNGAPSTSNAPAPGNAASQSQAPSAPPVPPPIGAPTNGSSAVAPAAPAAEAPAGNNWGSLDSIPSPTSAPKPGAAWGDLDSIPAPASAPGRGLGGGMLGKARANTASRPMFNKGRVATETPSQVDHAAVAAAAPPLDDAAAQAKLNQIMSKSNVTSDYVFATPGLDMRMLGRIDSWVSDIENKDAFKHGHARQTAEYALAIARECGVPEKQLETIRQAALVHDVGKLGSSPALLQKPESEQEDTELLNIMKHPIAGAELLQGFPDLQHLAPIVLTHREEFNGEGYPQGLKGEEIPLEARVIAVANGYHSMVSEMKYGPGMSPGAAQQRIVEEAGKKYDPKFVQALLQAIMSQKIPAVS